jgi:hypothetical protein
MNATAGCGRRGSIHVHLFVVILLATHLAFMGHAQNTDSLIQVLNEPGPMAAFTDALNRLPTNLRKIDLRMLGTIVQMRKEGITSLNAPLHEVGKRFSSSYLRVDNLGRMRIMVYLRDVDSVSIERVRRLSAKVEHINEYYNRLTCLVPFDVIEALSEDGNIRCIQCIPEPIHWVGEYTTAGDGILEADVARSAFGISGQNVKVGIISDGVDHWTAARDNQDLPANFTVLSNGRGGDEGTAMAEIIHDLAPGASLYFNDLGWSEDDTYSGIQALKNAGCKVIVDDIYWLPEPMFEDGTVAIGVQDATAAGVIYVSACGNTGTSTWDGFSSDSDGDGWIEFSGSNEPNLFTIAPHEELRASLQWANRYHLAWENYDLWAFEGSSPDSRVLAAGVGSHPNPDGFGIAYEWVYVPNNSDIPLTCYFRVKHIRGFMPREIKLLVFGGAASGPLNYRTDGGIVGHAAAASCISVGAINASSPEIIASYSSHGPSRIYSYNAGGTPISSVDRATPSICGIDEVQTYIGSDLPSHWPPGNPVFKGTSAAAPHIAGISALLLQLNSSLNWQQTKDILTWGATKVSGMGGQNFTNAYGFGRVDAYQSGFLALASASKSWSSQSTAFNGQRKLYRESSGTLHEVFASGMINGGEIIYRNSTDNGATWGGIARLSDGTMTSLAPCITMGAGSTVIVAWQQTNGSNYNVLFRRSSNGGGAWGSITTLQVNFSCASPGPLPSVSANMQTGGTVVIYRSSSGLRYLRSTNAMVSWDPPTTISGTTGTNNSPSTALYPVASPMVDKCNVAFATDVGYSSLPYYRYYSLSEATNLASVLPAYYRQHLKPSLASSATSTTTVHVAWEATNWDSSLAMIVHRKGSSGNFGSQYSRFYYQSPTNPSISGLSSDDAWMVFRANQTGTVARMRYTGSQGSWGTPIYGPAGNYGHVSVGSTSARYLYTSGTSSPYTVSLGSETLSKEDLLATYYSRELNLIDTKAGASLTLEVEQPQLVHKDGTATLVAFVDAPPDSVLIGTKEILLYGNTEPFALSSLTDTLKVRYRIRSMNSADLLPGASAECAFTLHDGKTGESLSTIGTGTIAKSADTTSAVYEIAVAAGSIPNFSAGTELAIDVALSGVKVEGPDLIASLGHIYRFTGEGGAELPKDVVAEDLGPKRYLLEQNYPNPFNPSTTLRYGLPEAAHVTLMVYNTLGQKVAELVNGDVNEGYHEARWDAAGVASGIYFARLTVTGVLGQIVAHQTAKLILTK